jgi:hypothetical protein
VECILARHSNSVSHLECSNTLVHVMRHYETFLLSKRFHSKGTDLCDEDSAICSSDGRRLLSDRPAKCRSSII